MSRPTLYRMFWPLLLFLALGVGTTLLFYPGGLNDDVIDQLAQAASGIYNDHHPVAMSVLLAQLNRIAPGGGLLYVLTMAMYWGGLFLIARHVGRRPRCVTYLLTAALGLFPSMISTMIVVWKDAVMAGAFLMAIGLYLATRHARHPWAVVLGLLALVFAMAGVSVRHNAAAALVPLAAFAFWQARIQFRPVRRFLSATVMGLAVTAGVFLLSHFLVSHLVRNIIPSNIWQIAALYDIAGISHRLNENLFDPGIYPQVDLAFIHQHYSPVTVQFLVAGDSVTRPFRALLDTPTLARLRANWIRAITEHWPEFLAHRWDAFAEMLFHPWRGVCRACFENAASTRNALLVPPIRPSPVRDRALLALEAVEDHTRLFMSWLYVVGSVAVFLAALVTRIRPMMIFAFCASGWAYLLSLFFLAVSPPFRYMHWMVAVDGLAALVLLVGLWQRYGPGTARGVAAAVHDGLALGPASVGG